ncbi:hypothetical protein [Streptomyces sp. bgisy027]|uniref:hypothetical protein n=1 Tax=unclassified Streptomyces TaxID=2593676 RepID=UPI003D7179A5
MPTDRRSRCLFCGTGALSALVAERHDPRRVLGCDRSGAFVAAAAAAPVRGAGFVCQREPGHRRVRSE